MRAQQERVLVAFTSHSQVPMCCLPHLSCGNLFTHLYKMRRNLLVVCEYPVLNKAAENPSEGRRLLVSNTPQFIHEGEIYNVNGGGRGEERVTFVFPSP